MTDFCAESFYLLFIHMNLSAKVITCFLFCKWLWNNFRKLPGLKPVGKIGLFTDAPKECKVYFNFSSVSVDTEQESNRSSGRHRNQDAQSVPEK